MSLARNAVIEALKDRGKLCASCGTAGIQGSAAGAGAPSANPAYANTQTVLIDDKAVTFQTCALKDSFGKLTNRIRIWDIAYSLNGAKVQFGADWFYGLVNLLPSPTPPTAASSVRRFPATGRIRWIYPPPISTSSGNCS